MALGIHTGNAGFLARARELFKSRDVFIHDGSAVRRFHVSTRIQILAASGLLFAATSAVAGIAGVAASAPAISGAVTSYAARQAEVTRMEARVASLQDEVSTIRRDAKQHAARLEQRQEFLATVLQGKGDAASLAALLPARSTDGKTKSAYIVAAFAPVEAEQVKLAMQARAMTDARFRDATKAVSRLGINPRSFNVAMGGPYEPVTAAAIAQAQSLSPTAATGQADPQFRALFNSWKRLDQLQQVIVSIPSQRPVQSMSLTSNFGIRTDPFRGGAAMHSGVDIPGAYATPIFATADGVVNRAQWQGGYGNLVELDHGRGIQTRYGHLSSLLVVPGTRVKRGQMIALMGSTGRSTGNHLHYEVRLDGIAVNPAPFLQKSDYLVAMQKRAQSGTVAMGGPAKAE